MSSSPLLNPSLPNSSSSSVNVSTSVLDKYRKKDTNKGTLNDILIWIFVQNFYKITASNKFQAVIQFLRKELQYKTEDPLFLYVNSAFSPAPDEIVANLHKALPTKKFKPKLGKPCKSCIVLGSGGHTMEMLQLLKGLDYATKYRPRLYIVSSNDTLSVKKVQDLETAKGGAEGEDYRIVRIPRARHVGESWLTTPFSVAKALIASTKVVLWETPDLIICNGPGICVPVCVISYIHRILGIKRIYLIYVESFARVKSLSLSGRLLIRFVDTFLVQWPYLERQYSQAEYKGVLV
ncbi:1515_t:CDS:2 [Paraglomus occultum]|uniref:UDP-N-acetylglucosamine transferase subunit ALG14 n=1 Tax=Paraglomus occultum TaxID=144539 RepID=A0A9N9EZI5_9GLOM|nr:1515_t:CDS:2 [Paraglomus occultum]